MELNTKHQPDVLSCVQMYGRKFGMHDVCKYMYSHSRNIGFPVLSDAIGTGNIYIYSIPSDMDMDRCVFDRYEICTLFLFAHNNTCTIWALFGHFYTPPY